MNLITNLPIQRIKLDPEALLKKYEK